MMSTDPSNGVHGPATGIGKAPKPASQVAAPSLRVTKPKPVPAPTSMELKSSSLFPESALGTAGLGAIIGAGAGRFIHGEPGAGPITRDAITGVVLSLALQRLAEIYAQQNVAAKIPGYATTTRESLL